MTQPPNTDSTYSDVPSPDHFALQSKRMDLDSGVLGKWFGNSDAAPSNIAGMCLVLLIATGIGLLFIQSSAIPPIEYWKLTLPVVTLILGYLFGKKN
jgi:hypothetical protein